MLKEEKTSDESCNCRNKNKWPLKGDNCRAGNVIYKASVITKNETKIYFRLTANHITKRISAQNTTINCKPCVLGTKTSMLT